MDVQERGYLNPELQEQAIAPQIQTHMVYQMDQTNDSCDSGDDTGYTGQEIRYELIGKRVREYRKKQRLTQQALAEKVGAYITWLPASANSFCSAKSTSLCPRIHSSGHTPAGIPLFNKLDPVAPSR